MGHACTDVISADADSEARWRLVAQCTFFTIYTERRDACDRGGRFPDADRRGWGCTAEKTRRRTQTRIILSNVQTALPARYSHTAGPPPLVVATIRSTHGRVLPYLASRFDVTRARQ